jgi:hypothetical protein
VLLLLTCNRDLNLAERSMILAKGRVVDGSGIHIEELRKGRVVDGRHIHVKELQTSLLQAMLSRRKRL